jgi:AsmA family
VTSPRFKFLRSKVLRSRRGVAAIAALLLILFLFRPGVYALRNRIANSIGSALGRRVSLDNVRLRVLPRPGFDLEGLVIYDDPAFSEEPMIRAQEVSAAIRLRSLLHGRVEIATLTASEPSINLVRNHEGRWNLASLVERNAQIPAAPTAKAASERRPAFPYLEASHARINFKIGQTKKSYALMDADVALWQDSENSWGARMKAAPIRTDFNLTDTGLLQVNATWQRAATLRATPMQIAVQWQNGQLGQITKLLSGKDRGWRGGVNFTAKLSGTPEALSIAGATTIDSFHRYDIVGSENVRLSTSCTGQYNAVVSYLTDLLCESPVHDGILRLRGDAILNTQPPTYKLTFSAVQVPLTSVVRLLRQAKNQIPEDVTASGWLNAEFLLRSDARSIRNSVINGRLDALPPWSGTGSASDVRLLSNAGKDEVAIATVPLALGGADSQETSQVAKRGRPKKEEQQREQEPAEPRLRIGPMAVAMNASEPVNAGGWISPGGYRFFLRGDMDLKDLFRLEDVFGLPVGRPAAEGSAKLDVSVSGPWQGFAPPATLGTAQLHNVRAEVHGLNTPIEIGSATLSLTPEAALLQKISARTGSTHWSGGVTAPRHCAVPGCTVQFDLTADQLSTGDFAEWFTPPSARRPWYRILNSTSEPQGSSPLLAIQARGNLQVGRFGLKKVVATQVATQVDLDRGKITLTGLRGQLLQGTHQGNWIIDASHRDVSGQDTSRGLVRYHGSGALRNISLAQVGALMNDAWITGTADGNFDLDGAGDSLHELVSRSDGKLQFVMRNGSLTHVEIPGAAGPLPVHRFAGELHLRKSAWELSAGRLESRDGFYQARGTASAGSGLDFVLTRSDGRSWTFAGTLAMPRVAAVSRTNADAKPVKP